MQEPARVRELLAAWVDPDAVRVIRSAVYRFHAVMGEPWRTGSVLLAGDAAHQMPPFLGQGMCAGIRDADNLAWKLGLVLGGRAGDALLDSYEAERAPHVGAVIETAVQLGRVVCTRDPELARERDESLLAGDSAPPPPALPGLTSGLLEAAPRHPLAGQLALQARVRDDAGREGLLDDLTGPGFTLVWGGPSPCLTAEARAVAETLGVQQIGFGPAEPGGDGPSLEDPAGETARWLERHGAAAVLVRPDHVVFGVARAPGEASELLRSLAEALA